MILSVSLPGLTGHPSIRCLLGRPVKPGDDSKVDVNRNEKTLRPRPLIGQLAAYFRILLQKNPPPRPIDIGQGWFHADCNARRPNGPPKLGTRCIDPQRRCDQDALTRVAVPCDADRDPRSL